ncbi:hypothetical protein SAMN05444161_4677 [Rhizobiales bacterium GAS191]|nr:hypothetical protein SAMN05444161_4677 [Rhizobiales bacterium GAS191]
MNDPVLLFMGPALAALAGLAIYWFWGRDLHEPKKSK